MSEDVPLYLWQHAFLLVLNGLLIFLFSAYIARKFQAGLFYTDSTKVGWGLLLGFAERFVTRADVLAQAHEWGTARLHVSLRVLALVLSIWSSICLLRVFAGVAWGKRAWAWALGAAFIVATLGAWPF